MRKPHFSREDVVAAGLAVVGREGLGQLTARRVAEELGSSTAPVYSNFANMDELADEVKRTAVRDLLAATRRRFTDDAFLNIGLGVLRFVWERPAVYAALFLERSTGYDPGPDFMDALVAAMARLPQLDPLPMAERVIVLKKLALFTHGLATEICQGCQEPCTLAVMEAMMREVGDAVLEHARGGIERDPETTRRLAAFWEGNPDAALGEAGGRMLDP
jgi:AcrR family transcriptional regulator